MISWRGLYISPPFHGKLSLGNELMYRGPPGVVQLDTQQLVIGLHHPEGTLDMLLAEVVQPIEQDLVFVVDPDFQTQLALQVVEGIEQLAVAGHEERVAKSGARGKVSMDAGETSMKMAGHIEGLEPGEMSRLVLTKLSTSWLAYLLRMF